MNTLEAPIARLYDLNRLSDAGYETDIVVAAPEEREKLAQWANVVDVKSFHGHIVIRRTAPSRFSYAAKLEAEITQSCTVTLEPVSARIDMEFSRALHLVSHATRVVDFSGALSLGAGDDGTPEEIDDPRFDLAAPLLEEFLLAIDPYPRAPGVAFEAPKDADDAEESPFAVLKGLKPQA